MTVGGPSEAGLQSLLRDHFVQSMDKVRFDGLFVKCLDEVQA
jgi:hypothetical protein